MCKIIQVLKMQSFLDIHRFFSIDVCFYLLLCVCACTWVYACMYVCMCVCVCVCMLACNMCVWVTKMCRTLMYFCHFDHLPLLLWSTLKSVLEFYRLKVSESLTAVLNSSVISRLDVCVISCDFFLIGGSVFACDTDNLSIDADNQLVTDICF